MKRLSVLAGLLALGVLIGLSAEKPADAAPRVRPPTVRVATTTTNYTVTFNSQVGKVRTFDLPPNYDEKGNPKKYTKDELQKLKGDTPAEKKLPGYKGEFTDLKVGDIVQLHVSVFKPTKTSSTDKPKGNANPDAENAAAADDALAKPGKWVVQQQVAGRVTKIVGGPTAKAGKKGGKKGAKKAAVDSDPKVTIQVVSQVLTTGRTTGTNRKTSAQTLDPEKYNATVIVVTRPGTTTKPTK